MCDLYRKMIDFLLHFLHSLENIFSVSQASFTAFVVAKCHVIYLSTNYLLINSNKSRKLSIM